MTNAMHRFQVQHDHSSRLVDALAKLQQKLGLEHYPFRIECFDISQFQGKQIVGAMAVLEEGEAKTSQYRSFKVRTVAAQDDFASIYEVLERRFKHTLHGDWPKPDLVVIDGGKGQLNQAVAVLADLGIHDLDIISLAKSRLVNHGQSVERSLERVFLVGRKNPLILKRNSVELFLLERVRNEAHRFAINYHRRLRRKQTIRSKLDEIGGIGPTRRKALLIHFGSLRKIRDASIAELMEVPGINARLGKAIFVFFNSAAAFAQGPGNSQVSYSQEPC